MTNKQAYAGLRERLLHMANTHHAIKDCPAMIEAAEAISSLLKALEQIEREASEEHVAYRCALDGIAKMARAALNSDAPLSIGEEQ